MQYKDDDEITICDECIPYESNDSDEEFEEYERTNLTKRMKRRQCLYYTSYVVTVSFIVTMFYWTYYVIANEDELSQNNNTDDYAS